MHRDTTRDREAGRKIEPRLQEIKEEGKRERWSEKGIERGGDCGEDKEYSTRCGHKVQTSRRKRERWEGVKNSTRYF
jgi:hypothetical protein